MRKRILLPALLLTLAVGASQAQTKKEKDEKSRTSSKVQVQSENGTTKVHVEKQRDGKTEVYDRSFSDQASADAFLDSVNAGTGNRVRITQRGGGNAFEYNNDRNDNYNYNYDGPTPPKPPKAPKAPKAPRVRIYGDDDKTVQLDMRNFNRDMERFGRDMERWSRDNADRIKDLSLRNAEKMKEWGQKFEREYKQNWRPENFNFNLDTRTLPGMAWTEGNASSRTVKALSAYPNQPFNGRLNVSFQAPEKGDVTILVTDVTGKEVARERVKDFSGKYVGQVDLKKSPDKGTFFLTVTQGVDGAVKRIVVE